MADRLTTRQLECLRLSATMTDKDIARHLGISHHTVSLHVRQAMRRLSAPSRKAALRRIADDPLYASGAIPPPIEAAADRSAPDDLAGDAQLATQDRLPGAWLLPPPPRRSLRPALILVFAAVAALITVGIVNVVSEALSALAPLAPLAVSSARESTSSVKEPAYEEPADRNADRATT